MVAIWGLLGSGFDSQQVKSATELISDRLGMIQRAVDRIFTLFKEDV